MYFNWLLTIMSTFEIVINNLSEGYDYRNTLTKKKEIQL